MHNIYSIGAVFLHCMPDEKEKTMALSQELHLKQRISNHRRRRKIWPVCLEFNASIPIYLLGTSN